MKRKFVFLSLAALACVAFLVACVFLDSVNVEQPQPDGTMAPRIKVNEVATFVVNGHIETSKDNNDTDDEIFVFAMLAPRCWDIRNNVTVTYESTVVLDEGEQRTMAVIPDNVSPKNNPGYTWPEALRERLGLGPNKYNDMEWVAWQAEQSVDVHNGDKPNWKINIKCKVNDDNLAACIGFFVNYVKDGFSTDDKRWKVMYSEPFTVYGGPGEMIDYSRLRFNSVEPSRALQDDIVTITFAGDSYDNDLIHEDEIYLEATAYTDEGNVYKVDKRDSETLMRRANSFSREYSTTIWPAGFFSIQEDETITRIEYIFTNRDGSVIVNKSLGDLKAGDSPESDDIPFTFNLICG